MPIYEYRCVNCGFEKEALQKVSDPLLTTCPRCGQEALQKLVSAAGFQLKGTGWYATDFKGSRAAPAKQGQDGAADGAAKAESKTDKGGSQAAQGKPASEAKADKPSSGEGSESHTSSSSGSGNAAS